MLAEISTYDPPILIPAVLGCLGFGLWIYNSAAEAWRNLKDKPTGQEILDKARDEFQPIGDYQAKGDYITRAEWAAREITLAQALQNLSTENHAILKAGEKREQHITDRIDEVQTNMGKLPNEFMALLANAMNIANAGKSNPKIQ